MGMILERATSTARGAGSLTQTATQRNKKGFSFFEKEEIRQFTASRGWPKAFMDRHRFALRKPHMKQKPSAQPGALDRFRGKLAEIVNFRKRMPKNQRINQRSQDAVLGHVNGNGSLRLVKNGPPKGLSLKPQSRSADGLSLF
jgi:hypothetical protein